MLKTEPSRPGEDDAPEFILDGDELVEQPPASRGRLARRIAAAIGIALVLLILFLAVTAPLSKSLQPITAPSITLVSAEGHPIARRGSVTDLPVKVSELPKYVPEAFLAIEDRRFYEHIGIDPWGLARAVGRNVTSGGVVQGGSTITQQLAKLSFLSSKRTFGRKAQEAILALWLETWLSKEEILSRYMSGVYFGDNVYGLRAAANHYFSRRPEELTIEQAAMLAGLVKAPTSLAPTSHLEAARARSRLVINAMVEAGYISKAVASRLPPVTLKEGPIKDVPTGTYFADWLFSQLGSSEPRYGQQRIQTTLEDRLQRQAALAIRSAGINGAQVALIAMHPDGRVAAMVGGRSYRESPFNRATQAKRQAGSTFKLFVYLAAMRSGYTPATMIDDAPIRIGNWSPDNFKSQYRGKITLREAFAHSSNVAAVRLSETVGRGKVIQAARDLGITDELEKGPTLPLGTSAVSLIEMTSAYASVANGSYPVKPRGLPEADDDRPTTTPFEAGVRHNMLDLLWAVTHEGSGRAAAIPQPTFGKTGTTQGGRDAYFIGFAGDLVTGVWIGRDDNKPLGDIQGGGIPARIWHAFMAEAVKNSPAASGSQFAAPPPTPAVVEVVPPVADTENEAVNVSGYDVDEPAGAAAPEAVPAEPSAAEPVDDDAAGGEPAQSDDSDRPGRPDRAPRDIPTIAAPPPPPPQDEEPPPDGE